MNTTSPYFSVVIPVYNVEAYLRDCLDSVVNQSFSDIELVCVDDGSTDGSLKILQEYERRDARIRVISQDNMGLSGARNTGIDAACGRYILFLDSDDWIYENDTLVKLYDALDGEDLLAFDGVRYDEQSKEIMVHKPIEEGEMGGLDYWERYCLVGSAIPTASACMRLYRREFLKEHNLRFEVGIYHEDNLFTPMAAAKAYRVKVTSIAAYVYRQRQGSIMTSCNPKRNKDIIFVANKLASYFVGVKEPHPNINRYISGLYLRSFMSEERLTSDLERELLSLIDWKLIRCVSTYPRHRRLCRLLHCSPSFMRFYLKMEGGVKLMIRS